MIFGQDTETRKHRRTNFHFEVVTPPKKHFDKCDFFCMTKKIQILFDIPLFVFLPNSDSKYKNVYDTIILRVTAPMVTLLPPLNTDKCLNTKARQNSLR